MLIDIITTTVDAPSTKISQAFLLFLLFFPSCAQANASVREWMQSLGKIAKCTCIKKER